MLGALSRFFFVIMTLKLVRRAVHADVTRRLAQLSVLCPPDARTASAEQVRAGLVSAIFAL
jgi:hypothetical protein